MACKNICKLCDKLILTTAVNFDSGIGLILTIPAGSYKSGEKYCLVVAQAIPDEATINAPVVVRITTASSIYYPVTKCNCSPLLASSVRTRTKYSTKLITNANGATFKLLGNTCCVPDNKIQSIDGVTN